MQVFILGADGFIGSHLIKDILAKTQHSVTAFDINFKNLKPFENHERFKFFQGDIFKADNLIEEQVKNSDIVFPLAGIAKPSYYLSNPLWTFELDFEQNLKIVRLCVKYDKRIIFPSTSEVYGLSSDEILKEDESPLIVGPINKMRWIYSCGKQLIDRVITAYGIEKNLRYTLFRPFNWVGDGLDTLKDAEDHKARSITQIIYDILYRKKVTLVAGGEQRRSFTWIDDGINALLKILDDEKNANAQIFNIGNPNNNASIKELALKILDVMKEIPAFANKIDGVELISIPSEKYYSYGYDDMKNRVPSIEKLKNLGWTPKINLHDAIKFTLEKWPTGE